MFALEHVHFSKSKNLAMVTLAYYGKNGGKILPPELYLIWSILMKFENVCPRSVDVQDTLFRAWQLMFAIQGHIKEWGEKSCFANYFLAILIVWQRCLTWSVDVQDTFWKAWQQEIAH